MNARIGTFRTLQTVDLLIDLLFKKLMLNMQCCLTDFLENSFFRGRKSRALIKKGAAETAASQEFGTCLLHGSLPLLYTLYLSFECVRE